MIQQYDVYGLKVSNFTLNEVDDYYSDTIKSNKNIVLFGHSLGYIVWFKKNPELYPIVNSFDLMVCDGTQFHWYCSLNGFRLKTVISIPDITNYTLKYANAHGLKVLLFGAKEEINKKASENIKKQYPNIQVLPGINGYYSKEEETQIVQKIENLKPHILLVGMSSPLKEKFAHTYREKLGANIIIPCGGMIDVYSGFTKQSPAWVKKTGLAIPYRVLQEPKRLFAFRVWMIGQILFKILPQTFLYKAILRQKNYNLVERYIA